MRRLHVKRRKIDGDSIEAVADVLPAAGRDDDMNQRQHRTGLRIANCGLRIDRSLLEKSRRDGTFIERRRPIDLGEPIYGRKTIDCAPKGAAKPQFALRFSK